MQQNLRKNRRSLFVLYGVQVLHTFKAPLTTISAACIHNKALPQLLKACVNTKSANVRLAALEVVASLAPRLSEQESDVVGRMIKHLTGIDSSDPTLSSVMDVRPAVPLLCSALGRCPAVLKAKSHIDGTDRHYGFRYHESSELRDKLHAR